MDAIVVEGVEKSYGSFEALHGVSFNVKRGEVFGFLGPNGAGKTTTMRIVSTLLPPDVGNVFVCGHSVVDDPVEVKKLIGLLPERFGFYEEMTAFSYLNFNASFYLKQKDEREKKCTELLGLMGLKEVSDKRIRTFSHGMRQKLAMALSMVNDPEVLIMDEPTNGLDPEATFEFESLIKDLKKSGRTIFLSSHILPEVEKLCDRVCILNRGDVIAQDSIDGISKHLKGLRIAVNTLGFDKDIVDRIRAVEGIMSVEASGYAMKIEVENQESIAKVNAFLVKNDVGVVEIRNEEMNLEEIFLSLVRGV